MLKIRIVGLPAESEQAAKLLGDVFDVLEYDGPKDRRGASKLVSYYVTAELRRSTSSPSSTTQDPTAL